MGACPSQVCGIRPSSSPRRISPNTSLLPTLLLRGRSVGCALSTYSSRIASAAPSARKNRSWASQLPLSSSHYSPLLPYIQGMPFTGLCADGAAQQLCGSAGSVLHVRLLGRLWRLLCVRRQSPAAHPQLQRLLSLCAGAVASHHRGLHCHGLRTIYIQLPTDRRPHTGIDTMTTWHVYSHDPHLYIISFSIYRYRRLTWPPPTVGTTWWTSAGTRRQLRRTGRCCLRYRGGTPATCCWDWLPQDYRQSR